MGLVLALDQALFENLQGVHLLVLHLPHQENLPVEALAEDRQKVEVVDRVLFIHRLWEMIIYVKKAIAVSCPNHIFLLHLLLLKR